MRNMIPVIEFVDCTPEQIAQRIEELMGGDMLAREIVVKTLAGETVALVWGTANVGIADRRFASL
jgi:hypothetical protein